MTFEFQIERGNEQLLTFLEHTIGLYHSRNSTDLYVERICSTSHERVLDQVKEMRGRITTLWAGVRGSCCRSLFIVNSLSLVCCHPDAWPPPGSELRRVTGPHTRPRPPPPLHCLQTHARPGRQWLVRSLCVRTEEKGCKPLRESWESIRAFSSKSYQSYL